MEELKDGYCIQTKYEATVKNHRSPHLVLFMNFDPDYGALSADRWHVITHTTDDVDIFEMFPPSRFPAVAKLADPITGATWDTAHARRTQAPHMHGRALSPAPSQPTHQAGGIKDERRPDGTPPKEPPAQRQRLDESQSSNRTIAYPPFYAGDEEAVPSLDLPDSTMGFFDRVQPPPMPPPPDDYPAGLHHTHMDGFYATPTNSPMSVSRDQSHPGDMSCDELFYPTPPGTPYPVGRSSSSTDGWLQDSGDMACTTPTRTPPTTRAWGSPACTGESEENSGADGPTMAGTGEWGDSPCRAPPNTPCREHAQAPDEDLCSPTMLPEMGLASGGA